MHMRTTLNIDDQVLEKASKLTGIKENRFGATWLRGLDCSRKRQTIG
jgi:hypothetical protein